MKAPQAALMITRSTKVLIFPLRHPDAQAEFYGYDRQTIPSVDGVDRPSSKWLIATVGWIATALVARWTRQYVGSKAEAVQRYKTHINDQWTNLIEQVYEQCRNRWNYLIPEAKADRQVLRSLCQDTLELSNHYLTVYRNYLLAELSEGVPQNQLLAVKQLTHVIYPGDEDIANSLNKLQQSSDERLRKAAFEADNQIKQILGVST